MFEEENQEIKDKTNDELESILISCLLNNHKNSEDIFLLLSPSDFGSENNRIIFAAANELRKESKISDTVSLISYIDSNQTFQFDNYNNYIKNLSAKYSYEPNIKAYIEIVKNNSIIRQLKNFGKFLSEINMDVTNSGEILWDLEKRFLDITNSMKTKDVETLSEIMVQYHNKLESLKDRVETLTGTTSGYPKIDKITNGFQPGDLIILAARPGIGKTAIALNFLLNAAKELMEINLKKDHTEKEKIVLMFSMEMGNLQISERLVSIQSGVDITVNRRGEWKGSEWLSVSDTISTLSGYPIYIDDSSSLSIIDIQSKLKQLSNNKEIKLIVVDYLQLLKGPGSKVQQINRQQEIASISRTLKSIARQYEVPIIAIAQLSRKIEERKGEHRRPILSDIRESGAIEQDADIVSFLNYLDEESITKNTENKNNDVMVEYIIAKHRNGATGSVDLLFKKSIGKFISENYGYRS
ncbi:MAG: replicative DNA helicase [Mycoplasmoidaceae bacterium]